jgi:hypothetical protein
MVNAIGIEHTRPPDDTMDRVTMREQIFSPVRAMLARNPGDKCNLHYVCLQAVLMNPSTSASNPSVSLLPSVWALWAEFGDD